MMLTLSSDDGTELFAWGTPGMRIDFAASVKQQDRMQLCFDIHTPDPKGLAKAVARQRAQHKGNAA